MIPISYGKRSSCRIQQQEHQPWSPSAKELVLFDPRLLPEAQGLMPLHGLVESCEDDALGGSAIRTLGFAGGAPPTPNFPPQKGA